MEQKEILLSQVSFLLWFLLRPTLMSKVTWGVKSAKERETTTLAPWWPKTHIKHSNTHKTHNHTHIKQKHKSSTQTARGLPSSSQQVEGRRGYRWRDQVLGLDDYNGLWREVSNRVGQQHSLWLRTLFNLSTTGWINHVRALITTNHPNNKYRNTNKTLRLHR